MMLGVMRVLVITGGNEKQTPTQSSYAMIRMIEAADDDEYHEDDKAKDDDTGDGDASEDERKLRMLLIPPANRASSITCASENSFPCFILGRLPICFPSYFLCFLLRQSLKSPPFGFDQRFHQV
jgi:hypothetical protein